MDCNLPVLYEEKKPYKRTVKKKKSPFFGICLFLILVAALLAVLFFFGKDLQKWFGFAEETTGTEPGHTETTDLYAEPGEIPEGATPIKPYDLSADTLGIFAANEKNLAFDEIERWFPTGKEGGTVLILNSHAYRSYVDGGKPYYTDAAFATSGENTIGAVCETLANTLYKRGIHAVFLDSETENAIGVYENTEKMMENALALFPDTLCILDVNTLVLQDKTGALVRPVAETDGKITAQVQLHLGTLAAYEHTAGPVLFLYETLKKENPSFVMPLAVEEKRMHQRETLPVLHLTVGTVGNTLAEAENAAVLLGNSLGNLLLPPDTL